MKFINHTGSSVKKRKALPRKKRQNKSALPGVSKLKFQTSSSSSTPTSTEKKRSNENSISRDKSPTPTAANSLDLYQDFFNELPDSSILQKELSRFMIQPEQDLNLTDFHSLGFTGPLTSLDEDWANELIQNLDILEETQGDNNNDGDDETLQPRSTQNEFRLACHYCRIMVRFYSVKTAEWNFYAMVNEAFAYRYKPLKYSILAWSALHLSIIENEPWDIAHRYYEIALKSLMGQDFLQSDIPLEILLVGSYFLCLFDIMAGKSHTLKILRHVYHSVKIGSLFHINKPDPTSSSPDNNKQTNSTVPLSAFSYQILTWLIYLDIRSSLFMGNIQFPDHIIFEARKQQNRQSKHPDFQYLVTSDVYEKKVVSTIFDNSRNVLKTSFGLSYPNESEKTDKLQDIILKMMMKNMLMFGTLIRLKSWLTHCGNSVEFNPNTLEVKIHDLYLENKSLLSLEEANDEVSQFHILIELALIHAITIYFDRIVYPDIRSNEKCQRSCEEIFQIAMKLKKLRYTGTPGSMQWPFPLIIAGVETTNVIYQNWVLRELEDCVNEGWGLNIAKSKELTSEVIKRQNYEGNYKRLDIGEVMESFTGYFIA